MGPRDLAPPRLPTRHHGDGQPPRRPRVVVSQLSEGSTFVLSVRAPRLGDGKCNHLTEATADRSHAYFAVFGSSSRSSVTRSRPAELSQNALGHDTRRAGHGSGRAPRSRGPRPPDRGARPSSPLATSSKRRPRPSPRGDARAAHRAALAGANQGRSCCQRGHVPASRTTPACVITGCVENVRRRSHRSLVLMRAVRPRT